VRDGNWTLGGGGEISYRIGVSGQLKQTSKQASDRLILTCSFDLTRDRDERQWLLCTSCARQDQHDFALIFQKLVTIIW
jgi:hypothetical protein